VEVAGEADVAGGDGNVALGVFEVLDDEAPTIRVPALDE
jgi:hypothetical protein